MGEASSSASDQSWSVRANLTQGWRAVGGKLHVGEGRVLFRPHGFDRATGGHPLEFPLSDLAAIGIAPRTFHPFDGGLRKRLCLTFANGSDSLFVVFGPTKVGRRIEASANAVGVTPRVDL